MGHQSPETNSKSYASELRVSNCHYVPAPRGLHAATCFWQFRPLWWNWWSGEAFQKHTNQIGNKTPLSYVWHRSMFSETEERRRCGFALFGGGNLSGGFGPTWFWQLALIRLLIQASLTPSFPAPCTLHQCLRETIFIYICHSFNRHVRCWLVGQSHILQNIMRTAFLGANCWNV